MSKKRKKDEDINLDIDIFDDPDKLEKALLKYVSPSNRKRAKKNEKKAGKIASSFMSNIEEDLMKQISSDENQVDESNDFSDYNEDDSETCDWRCEYDEVQWDTECGYRYNPYVKNSSIYPEIQDDENGNEICPYCGKVIKFIVEEDSDEDESDDNEISETEEYEEEDSSTEESNAEVSKFPELVYGDEADEKSDDGVTEEEPFNMKLSQWFENHNNRIWIIDDYLGSKTFELIADTPLVDNYYDDDTTGEMLMLLFKHWLVNSRPEFIGSISEIKKYLSENGVNCSKVIVFVIRVYNTDDDLGYVYLELNEKKKEFMAAFDTVFEEYSNSEIIDLILRIGIYLANNTFFDMLNDEELHRFQEKYSGKDYFINCLKSIPAEDGVNNNTVNYCVNRRIFLDKIFELAGYEEDDGKDEGVEHDHEPFPTEESGDDSSPESGINSPDLESKSDDNRESIVDEAAGPDGESRDDDSWEEDEESEEKEEEVEEESDDESDIDLEKELEEGFDEIEDSENS